MVNGKISPEFFVRFCPQMKEMMSKYNIDIYSTIIHSNERNNIHRVLCKPINQNEIADFAAFDRELRKFCLKEKYAHPNYCVSGFSEIYFLDETYKISRTLLQAMVEYAIKSGEHENFLNDLIKDLEQDNILPKLNEYISDENILGYLSERYRHIVEMKNHLKPYTEIINNKENSSNDKRSRDSSFTDLLDSPKDSNTKYLRVH